MSLKKTRMLSIPFQRYILFSVNRMRKEALNSIFVTFATVFICFVVLFLPLLVFANYGNTNEIINEGDENVEPQKQKRHLTVNHFVRDIVRHPAFEGFGELMLPWDDNTKYYDTRLNQVGSLMPYHSHVNADVVVSALNELIDEVDSEKTSFTISILNGKSERIPPKSIPDSFSTAEVPECRLPLCVPEEAFHMSVPSTKVFRSLRK